MREPGRAEWKELAQRFLDVRGTEPSTFALEENRRLKKEGKKELPVTAERYMYYQAHKPVREMDEAVGHAVRQMYLASGMADEARLGNDEAMLAACERLWRSAVSEKMYVTGGGAAPTWAKPSPGPMICLPIPPIPKPALPSVWRSSPGGCCNCGRKRNMPT
jgi:DUF1680 family protein